MSEALLAKMEGGPDKQEGQTASEQPAQGPTEGSLLFLCLQRLATYFGRPSSKIVLTAGLPVEGESLDADLFMRAADRIGLRTEWRAVASYELSSADLPAIAWRSDGRPIILEELQEDRRIRVYVPEAATHELWTAKDAAGLREQFLNVAPVLESGDPNPALGDNQAKPHWLWNAARSFWPTYVQIGLAAAFINLLALAAPLFTMNVYDRVLPNKALPTLWVLAIGVVLAFLFDFVLRVVRASLIDYVTRRLDLRIASMLVERVLNTKLSNRFGTTGAMTQRLHEYEFVREFLGSNTIVFFIDLWFGILFLAVIAYISPLMALYPAAAMLLMVVVGFVVQRLIGRQLAHANYTTAHRQSLLVELVSGLETIKSLRGEGMLLRRWDTITREASHSQEKIKSYSAFASNLAYFVQLSVTVATIVVGAYLFQSGGITLGGIIAASMLASRAVAPMGQIALTLSRLRQALSSLKTLDELMRLPDERADRRLLVARTIREGRIEFRRASFAYQENGREILKDLSLTINPGERAAILGKVGVGKTTLGRLLIRLYELSSGEILIDGVDIRQYHPHEVRRAINFIGNDSDLFHGSLRENLLLAKPDASDEELVKAAQLAGLDELVGLHPLGYELPVGERGALLSSGQRQMVGLARAFLSGGKILFLDDPTSSMDMASERLFVNRLRASLTPDMTLLVATHRNAMLTLVNRLIVIDGGKVVADGPKDLILKKLSEGQGTAADPSQNIPRS